MKEKRMICVEVDEVEVDGRRSRGGESGWKQK